MSESIFQHWRSEGADSFCTDGNECTCLPTPRSIHTSTLVVGTIGCADFVTYTLKKTNGLRTGMKPVSMIDQMDSMGKWARHLSA